MSFSYNNATWTPRSTNEHALDILNNINSLLSQNNITNLLKPIFSNIVWIICIAVGAIQMVLDQVLYQAQQSFNLSNCDDAQVLNLLPIAGTELIVGTYSLVDITVTANSNGSCYVPSGSVLPFINGVNFLTSADITVLASQTGVVQAVSDTIGLIEVAPNQLNSFLVTPTNLSSVTNLSAAIAGRPQETAQTVRQRLEEGKVIDNNIDGTKIAIKKLTGINDCNIFFNPSASTNLILPGSIQVLPRKSYVVTLGTSSLLSQTYFERMTAETQGDLMQAYTTLSGQVLDFNYNLATAQNIYVKILLDVGKELTDAETNAVKNIILNFQSLVSIGMVITTLLLSNLYANFTAVHINSILVSLNGTDWYSRIDTYGNRYPLFLGSNIIIGNLT